MKNFSDRDIDRIIQMCWEDRTPFDAIKSQFEISEKEIISIMRNNLKEKSFLNWRKRVDNRKTKHNALSDYDKKRFKSKSQRQISFNRHK
ncbi:MAG: TIGR03643 family protein [Flammeovirgaceae bacterium]|tara:strand:- start:579 stop:848 length:270 start_codon:yes stop_codon:yes gene_type:complete